jgi:hypothetical protein
MFRPGSAPGVAFPRGLLTHDRALDAEPLRRGTAPVDLCPKVSRFAGNKVS